MNNKNTETELERIMLTMWGNESEKKKQLCRKTNASAVRLVKEIKGIV